MAADYTTEIFDAFRQYCAEGKAPVISRESIAYLCHCLGKAMRNAAARGEEVDTSHHPFFVLMTLGCDEPDLVIEFLTKVLKSNGVGS